MNLWANLPGMSAFVNTRYFLATTSHGVNGVDIIVNKHLVSIF